LDNIESDNTINERRLNLNNKVLIVDGL